MKTFGKVILGLVVAGVAAYAVKKVVDKKYTTVGADGEPVPRTKTVVGEKLDSIKKAAAKKALTILAWAAEHEQAVRGAGLLIGIAGDVIGSAFGIAGGVRKFKAKDKILDTLNDIKDNTRKDSYDLGWNDSLDQGVQGMREAIRLGKPFEILSSTGDILTRFNVVKELEGAI